MNIQEALKRTMDQYRTITGLRSYLISGKNEIKSASERNYFCKCLKVSTQALKKCEECTQEYYDKALQANEECIYSCHAGLIKWAVPITYEDQHFVIISEGIIAKRQLEDAGSWAEYLSKEYDLPKELIKRNFEIVATMNEEQMNASIKLLKDLISYNLAIYRSEQQK